MGRLKLPSIKNQEIQTAPESLNQPLNDIACHELSKLVGLKCNTLTKREKLNNFEILN